MPVISKERRLLQHKLKSFRVNELKALLQFAGAVDFELRKKSSLLRIALDLLKKNFSPTREVIAAQGLEEKILELYELSKIPLRRHPTLVPPLVQTTNHPMFIHVYSVVNAQKIGLIGSRRTVEFCLPAVLIHRIRLGKRLDGALDFEVQFKMWNCSEEDRWDDVYVSLEVNNFPLDVVHPSPHITYLTTTCILHECIFNKITISSPKPETLTDYAFDINVVKRIRTEDILHRFPLQKVDNTLYLVNEVFKKMMNPHKFFLRLVCPTTKTLVLNPCRGLFCKHPDVFELKTFLDAMQFYLKWKCPICKEPIAYDGVALDQYLKTYLGDGKTGFNFYKARRLEPLVLDRDGISCVTEIIDLV